MPFLYVPKIEDSQGLSESSSKKQNKTKGKKKNPRISLLPYISSIHFLDTLIKMNGWPHAAVYARKCS